MTLKLHPDALPKKDEHRPEDYSSLAEFAQDVITKEAWGRYFQVSREPGSDVVRILYQPRGDETRDPPIVYMGSDRAFREGSVHRADLRSEMAAFLRRVRS